LCIPKEFDWFPNLASKGMEKEKISDSQKISRR
jgi:hypothetical protein